MFAMLRLCIKFHQHKKGNKTMKYQVNDENFETYDDAVEYCYSQEVVYYYDAMQYLIKNDTSLKESLELADELGYSTKDLNSELLATLLYQSELINEIEEVE